MEYTISRTIQARSFEPVQYTVTGSTPQEAIDGLRQLLTDYPPNPHPKALEGDTDQINKEFALASQKDINEDSHLKLKPEILTHPNLPKPMHGLNPRTLLGQTWWDKTRLEAQKRTNYICIVCGVHKTKAIKHQWLEGHEYWEIDYKKGKCKVISIEPLCHYCHNFIHSGRLTEIVGGEKSKREVKEILEHGFKILSDNKLKCFPVTLELAKKLGVKTNVKSYKAPESKIEWIDWRLVLNGKEYEPVHKSYEDWKKYYAKLNKSKN